MRRLLAAPGRVLKVGGGLAFSRQRDAGAPAGPPGGITPTGWWEADAIEVADGADVTSWPDQSANNEPLIRPAMGQPPKLQTTGGTHPNSQPYVDFWNGVTSNDGLLGVLAANAARYRTDDFTYFVVWNWIQAASPRRGLCVGKSGATFGVSYVRGPGGTVAALVGDGSNFTYVGNASPAAAGLGVWHVAELLHSANNNSLYVNGTQVGTTDARGCSFAAGPLLLGAFYGTDTTRPDGLSGSPFLCAALLWYNTALSAGDRSLVRAALGAKYGITVA